jgi:hypothetical protein
MRPTSLHSSPLGAAREHDRSEPMKRDWDVIREVLLEIEADNSGDASYGESTDAVKTAHTFLLRNAGFIQGIDATTHDGPELFSPSLMWEWHELLDTIRSKPVWEKIKSTAQKREST